MSRGLLTEEDHGREELMGELFHGAGHGRGWEGAEDRVEVGEETLQARAKTARIRQSSSYRLLAEESQAGHEGGVMVASDDRPERAPRRSPSTAGTRSKSLRPSNDHPEERT